MSVMGVTVECLKMLSFFHFIYTNAKVWVMNTAGHLYTIIQK